MQDVVMLCKHPKPCIVQVTGTALIRCGPSWGGTGVMTRGLPSSPVSTPTQASLNWSCLRAAACGLKQGGLCCLTSLCLSGSLFRSVSAWLH